MAKTFAFAFRACGSRRCDLFDTTTWSNLATWTPSLLAGETKFKRGRPRAAHISNKSRMIRLMKMRKLFFHLQKRKNLACLCVYLCASDFHHLLLLVCIVYALRAVFCQCLSWPGFVSVSGDDICNWCGFSVT